MSARTFSALIGADSRLLWRDPLLAWMLLVPVGLGLLLRVLLPAGRDMRDQLSRLVPRGFAARTPTLWLRHLPRFLRGIQIRLQKLFNAGLARDAAAAAELSPLWRMYAERELTHQARGVTDPALEQFRWMLEELRVSLFAQELKTSVPVSVKRLEALWEQVQP